MEFINAIHFFLWSFYRFYIFYAKIFIYFIFLRKWYKIKNIFLLKMLVKVLKYDKQKYLLPQRVLVYRVKGIKNVKKGKKFLKKCWQRKSDCDNIISLTKRGQQEQWQLNSMYKNKRKVNLLKVIEPSTKVYGANQTKLRAEKSVLITP